MNPTSNPQPGMHLPEPTINAGATNPVSFPLVGAMPTPPQPSALSAPVDLTPSATNQQIEQATYDEKNTSDGEEQNDSAWIQKAEQILTRSSDDPYMESNAIAELKAQYLKTQHNMTIRVSDQQQ